MTQPAPTRTRPLELAALAAFGAVLWFSYWKGYNGALQAWGEFYWYVDYSHGFLRRGLVGTLVAPLRRLLEDRETFNLAIIRIYHAIGIGVLGTMALGFARYFARLSGHRLAAFLGVTIFLASPVVSIVAYSTGYVDILIMAVALGGAWLVQRRSYLVAAGIGAAAALVNEAAIFLWMPVALLALFGSDRAGNLVARLVCAFLPPLLVVAIPMLEAGGAARALISALPFDPALRESLIELQYGQTMRGQVATQIQLLQAHWPNFVISAVVTQLATAAIAIYAIVVAGGLAPSQRLFDWGRYWPLGFIMFAFAPFVLLVFSWDLSRMMSWTNFSAGLLLLLTMKAAAAAEAGR